MTVEDVDFQLLVEGCVDMIALAGVDGRLLYASPSSLSVLGCTSKEIVGQMVHDFVLAEDLPMIEAGVRRLRSRKADTVTTTARSLRRDGTVVWTEVTVRAVRDQNTGDITNFILVLRDISKRKRLEQQLAELAHRDGLTGLANRRAFDRALKQEWYRTLRDASQMSLLLLDIDHFKQFNDQHGHQVGDDCLRAVSSAVTRAVGRPTDLVARYGGEEIAVILPAVGMPEAATVAEEILKAVEALQIPASGVEHHRLTVSIGVATAVARTGGTITLPTALLAAADSALYRAKHEGRNRIATSLLVAPADCR